MDKAESTSQAVEIYRSERGDIELRVRLENETVWLSQSQMAQLFGVDRTVIVRHIGNIYKSEELSREATCAKNAHVQVEGGRTVRRSVPLYNLDMIISVGYRVNSRNATRFRQWATSVLKQYLVKGYAVNKRIAATLFLWFMEKNGLLHRKDGSKRIADATLVALTLMIAESGAQEKDMMVRVAVNLINKRND